MLKISILTIGDEICIGQIVNTNAAWIASKCTLLGADTIIHSTIGDDKESVKTELSRIIPQSDIILVTGGLGPTHDDMTKDILTEFFDDKLVLEERQLSKLKEFFAQRGRELSERNAAQAMLPSKCKALDNNIGTAPGMMFEFEGKALVSMPGVPQEMIYLMDNHVLPYIKNKIISENHATAKYMIINTSGIPEAYLADLIGNTDEFLNECTLAFLPGYGGVKLRIGAFGSKQETENEIERISKIIHDRAGKYIISYGEKTISETATEILLQNNLTISVAESCTAGKLGASLTDKPGSSQYFIGGVMTYSNESKIRLLNVSADTLDTYGAVSEQTAKEMALSVKRLLDTDISLSITGIAGPGGGTTEKPVGTVFIGLADKNGVFADKVNTGADRLMNRERAVTAALVFLINHLKKSY